MRRKPRADSLGLDVRPPPSKKPKLTNHGSEVTVNVDDQSYRRIVKELEKEEAKVIKNRASIEVLMRETQANRRKWIVEERPSIATVLKTFPSLRKYEYVSCFQCKFNNILYACTCIYSMPIVFVQCIQIVH